MVALKQQFTNYLTFFLHRIFPRIIKCWKIAFITHWSMHTKLQNIRLRMDSIDICHWYKLFIMPILCLLNANNLILISFIPNHTIVEFIDISNCLSWSWNGMKITYMENIFQRCNVKYFKANIICKFCILSLNRWQESKNSHF